MMNILFCEPVKSGIAVSYLYNINKLQAQIFILKFFKFLLDNYKKKCYISAVQKWTKKQREKKFKKLIFSLDI